MTSFAGNAGTRQIPAGLPANRCCTSIGRSLLFHGVQGRIHGSPLRSRSTMFSQFVREGIDVKMWDYIVRSALKLKVTPPTWIDIPQMMRLNVTTYNVLKMLG